jgi:hypothetical protein
MLNNVDPGPGTAIGDVGNPTHGLCFWLNYDIQLLWWFRTNCEPGR